MPTTPAPIPEAATMHERPPSSAYAPSVVLRFPFTGPGLPACLVVTALSLIPWAGGVGWALSAYFTVQAIAAASRGETRLPPLPRVTELGEHAALLGRAVLASVAVLAPLFIVMGAVIVMTFDAGVRFPDGLAGLGVVGTLCTLFFLPMSLATVALGGSATEALIPHLLCSVRERMPDGGTRSILLLYFGGFAIVLAVGGLVRFGLPGEAVARALSWTAQIVWGYVVGTSLLPQPEPAPAEPGAG